MTTGENRPRVGFIGAGRMATALAGGLLSSNFTTPERIVAGDVSPDACDNFARTTGTRTVTSNVGVADQSEIVVLAVKPQHVADVLVELSGRITAEHLVVSIAAGVPISTLTAALGEECRIVRVMPNTPCLLGAGAAGYAVGGGGTEEDGERVSRMFSTVGIAVRVPEELLDAVTGLSGSGPAFVYQIIEALSDGGVAAGLPRDIATRLSAQTVLGAARMVLETGENPATLTDAVASPGGTTIAGLVELERGRLRATLMNAVLAASARSRELGQSS